AHAPTGRPPHAAAESLLLSRRTDDPVVAKRADVRRRGWFEVVRDDPVRDRADGAAHAVELLLRVAHRHLLAVEHVVVALRRGLEPPGLLRAHLVERELD